MDLVTLTTADLAAGRHTELVRMIRSVRASAEGINLRMFLLLQRCTEAQRSEIEQIMPANSVVMATTQRLSLSAARNRLLEEAERHTALREDCVVAFPDDDAWYLPGFVPQLMASFARDRLLDMLVCRFSCSPGDQNWLDLGATPPRTADVVRHSSSNTMFFRGALVADLGEFDPTLGLGTPNVSGEDTDYVVRALLKARKTIHVPLPLVGHREYDMGNVAKYYRGSTLVLSRYAFKRPSLFAHYLRKLCVGAYLAARSYLSVQEYAEAMMSSFSEIMKVRSRRAPTA